MAEARSIRRARESGSRPIEGSVAFVSLLLLSISTACAPGRADGPTAGHPAVTDPVGFDPAYPPAIREFSFESHGSKLNAIMYVAAGAGPHPTIVLLHGYPGNERNLDLAQALRRAGMNAMYFNYRGAWGSGGEFSAGNAIEDAARAVAFARREASSDEYRGDPERVAIIGHSFGGFIAAITAAEDPTIPCFGFLAGADLGPAARMSGENGQFRQGFEAALAGAMDYESGPLEAEVGAFVQELADRADEFDVVARAPQLRDRAIFMAIGERDDVLPKQEHHDPVLRALREAGAERVKEVVYDDDHAFSAHRVALARGLVDWALAECW